ncbi:MAG: ribonuclease HII [Salinivirgaceae bacterium]|nr:ribonuclease HII [Salinivirgaceae bacterium]
MLLPYYLEHVVEAGCDEAGRGCLAGPVFAAAVVLPAGFYHPLLNDSKQMTEKNRLQLKEFILEKAISYAVASYTATEIDQVNILNASIYSMHRALELLIPRPDHIIVDGNRFKDFRNIPYQTVIKGDGKYASIAAASVLAKTFRDGFMEKIHQEYPQYGWNKNKGYPTKDHRTAIKKFGITPYHRKSFRLLDEQLSIDFGD